MIPFAAMYLMTVTIIFCITAYIVGSLSSAIVVCKLFKLPDPRTEGSKNPGTTNVLRIGGKVPAFITLVGDMLKGYLPVLIAKLIGIAGFPLGLIALSAFLGHLFPVFFNFHGGKGVATALGTFLALSPAAWVVIIFCWTLIVGMTRYVSLASIISVGAAVIFISLFAGKSYFLPTLLIAIITTGRHLENIKKLHDGTENKIQF